MSRSFSCLLVTLTLLLLRNCQMILSVESNENEEGLLTLHFNKIMKLIFQIVHCLRKIRNDSYVYDGDRDVHLENSQCMYECL